MRLLPVCLYGVLLCASVTRMVQGEAPVPARATPPATEGLSADAWAEIIRATVIATLPEKKVQDKHWGQTASVFSRYEIKTRKGRLSMKPITKEVNHGFWQRQTVTMLQPDETLQIEFQNAQRQPDGKLTFTMRVVLRARVSTEFAHWVYGVKGLIGEVEADVTVAAVTNCSLDLMTVQEKGDLLPSLQLVPEVTDLKLKVHDIDARKIGLIGGWAAEQIGDGSRSSVNCILNEFEGAILKDLRRKIEKDRDRLKISPAKLLGGTKPGASPQKVRSVSE